MSQTELNSAQPIRLMILDDDPVDLVTAKMILQQSRSCEYEIVSFHDVGSAINYLDTHAASVDLCLIDYHIGGNTTLDFIKLSHGVTHVPLPVIVMTSQPSIENDERLAIAGAYNYLDKSNMSAGNLERMIRYCLHRHEFYISKYQESSKKTHHLALITHALKTPLAAIESFNSMAEDFWSRANSEQEANRVTECFAAVDRNSKQMHHLIDESLEFSAVDSGHLTLNRQQHNLSKLLRDMIHDFSALAAADNIKLSLIAEDALYAYVDDSRFSQVVGNLMSNAIRYTEQGEVNVTLKECQKNGQDAVEFCVQDTGLGIPAEYHDAVFSENGKLHRKMMKNDNIMCLGLPIVKELVAMHGGSIEMQSKLGEGSMFTVYLPQHKPN